MTYIPGTTSDVPGEQKSLHKNPEYASEEPVSVVNVHDLKNPEEKAYIHEDQIWYHQLKYWLIGGGIAGLVFATFAIWNWKALFLLPLGPYIAYLAWHTRRWARKYSKKMDALG